MKPTLHAKLWALLYPTPSLLSAQRGLLVQMSSVVGISRDVGQIIGREIMEAASYRIVYCDNYVVEKCRLSVG